MRFPLISYYLGGKANGSAGLPLYSPQYRTLLRTWVWPGIRASTRSWYQCRRRYRLRPHHHQCDPVSPGHGFLSLPTNRANPRRDLGQSESFSSYGSPVRLEQPDFDAKFSPPPLRHRRTQPFVTGGMPYGFNLDRLSTPPSILD